MANGPGELEEQFSNPGLVQWGQPFGNAKTADASRVIREQAPIVATYRKPAPAGRIVAISPTEIRGFAGDRRAQNPLTVRIDIDDVTRATVTADVPLDNVSLGVTVLGFAYTLPQLAAGPHTVKAYAIDPISGEAVLLDGDSFTAITPLFDTTFYLEQHPEVGDAITAGQYSSAYDHFMKAGQFAQYDPSPYFSTVYFLTQNPAVAKRVLTGAVKSPFQLFLASGERAGLKASTLFDEQYYLAAHADVATAVAKHQYLSGLDHYLILGKSLGYDPLAPVAELVGMA